MYENDDLGNWCYCITTDKCFVNLKLLNLKVGTLKKLRIKLIYEEIKEGILQI